MDNLAAPDAVMDNCIQLDSASVVRDVLATSLAHQLHTDLVFVCAQGQRVNAHHSVLGLVSSLWKNLEVGKDEPSFVSVPDIDSETLTQCLNLLYLGSVVVSDLQRVQQCLDVLGLKINHEVVVEEESDEELDFPEQDGNNEENNNELNNGNEGNPSSLFGGLPHHLYVKCPSCDKYYRRARLREHLASAHCNRKIRDAFCRSGSLNCPFCAYYGPNAHAVARHIGLAHNKVAEFATEEEKKALMDTGCFMKKSRQMHNPFRANPLGNGLFGASDSGLPRINWLGTVPFGLQRLPLLPLPSGFPMPFRSITPKLAAPNSSAVLTTTPNSSGILPINFMLRNLNPSTSSVGTTASSTSSNHVSATERSSFGIQSDQEIASNEYFDSFKQEDMSPLDVSNVFDCVTTSYSMEDGD